MEAHTHTQPSRKKTKTSHGRPRDHSSTRGMHVGTTSLSAFDLLVMFSYLNAREAPGSVKASFPRPINQTLLSIARAHVCSMFHTNFGVFSSHNFQNVNLDFFSGRWPFLRVPAGRRRRKVSEERRVNLRNVIKTFLIKSGGFIVFHPRTIYLLLSLFLPFLLDRS